MGKSGRAHRAPERAPAPSSIIYWTSGFAADARMRACGDRRFGKLYFPQDPPEKFKMKHFLFKTDRVTLTVGTGRYRKWEKRVKLTILLDNTAGSRWSPLPGTGRPPSGPKHGIILFCHSPIFYTLFFFFFNIERFFPKCYEVSVRIYVISLYNELHI